jgi:hypothetical protein
MNSRSNDRGPRRAGSRTRWWQPDRRLPARCRRRPRCGSGHRQASAAAVRAIEPGRIGPERTRACRQVPHGLHLLAGALSRHEATTALSADRRRRLSIAQPGGGCQAEAPFESTTAYAASKWKEIQLKSTRERPLGRQEPQFVNRSPAGDAPRRLGPEAPPPCQSSVDSRRVTSVPGSARRPCSGSSLVLGIEEVVSPGQTGFPGRERMLEACRRFTGVAVRGRPAGRAESAHSPPQFRSNLEPVGPPQMDQWNSALAFLIRAAVSGGGVGL